MKFNNNFILILILILKSVIDVVDLCQSKSESNDRLIEYSPFYNKVLADKILAQNKARAIKSHNNLLNKFEHPPSSDNDVTKYFARRFGAKKSRRSCCH